MSPLERREYFDWPDPKSLLNAEVMADLEDRVDMAVVAVEEDVAESRKWFPVPTGADDAAELISRLAAGEKDIALRRNTYQWNQALGTIPADAHIAGAGKRLSKVEKGFNGTLATLADGAQLSDLTIDGKGTTRTGKGFLFTGTDGRQSLRQVRMFDLDAECLDFATAAGSQSEFIGCTFARYNGISRDVYSVLIAAAQQLSAVPRKFVACETDGTPFIDLGGCNDLFIGPGGYLGKLKFGAESRGVVVMARFGGDYASESPASTADTSSGSPTLANVTPTTGWVNGMHVTGAGIPADTIILSGAGTATMVLSRNCTANATGVAVGSSVLFVRGFNHHLSGDFGAQVVVAAGSNSAITVIGTHNNAPVLDLSTFKETNLLYSPRKPYEPTLSSGGTTPTLGNGTLVGAWSREGATVHFEIEFTAGSTTSLGTGDLRFALPIAPASGSPVRVVTGFFLDSSTTINYALIGIIASGTAYVNLRGDALAGAIGQGNLPAAVAIGTGDIFRITGSYTP